MGQRDGCESEPVGSTIAVSAQDRSDGTNGTYCKGADEAARGFAPMNEQKPDRQSHREQHRIVTPREAAVLVSFGRGGGHGHHDTSSANVGNESKAATRVLLGAAALMLRVR